MPKPTAKQVSSVSFAINLWKDAGETVVAKVQEDGRVLLGACSCGTWAFTNLDRDGVPGPWF